MFTMAEFIDYARSLQDAKWETKRKIQFHYDVDSDGIHFHIRTGEVRTATNEEISAFCTKFNTTLFRDPKDYPETWKKSYLLPIALSFDPELIDAPREDWEIPREQFNEGASKKMHSTRFERSPKARNACIAHHGHNCVICGFSFAATYGDFAAGYIHVHHLIRLADRQGEHDVDPTQDLVPVCPNCHAVIHLRGACLSIEEVKAMLRAQ